MPSAAFVRYTCQAWPPDSLLRENESSVRDLPLVKQLRKNRYLVSVPPILANMIIVPWVLRFAYGSEDMIWFSTITVGIGDPGYRPSWSDPVIRSDPVSACDFLEKLQRKISDPVSIG